ncbi:hypothetical protein LINPERHAP2_LOCUS18799, partial [Linum perenne]
SFRSDAVGFKGGIWLLWDSNAISLDILEFGTQFINTKGRSPDDSCFFLTAVYASPRATSQVLLWDVLERLSIGQNEPWVVIGDFNAILSAEDKVGGSPFERRRSKSFIDTVDLCRLSDLPFSGPRFTWSCNCTLSRIDRALVNAEWIRSMPESSVLHLHKIKSDHRPIVLCPATQVVSSNCKPFRFLSAWMSHPSFDALVKNKWIAGTDLPNALSAMSGDLKKWNKHTFAKLELVLWQEEAIWIHKSRSNWAAEGDRNTKFFHLAALKRRAVNRIRCLKDCNDVWIEDQKELLDMAVNFFGIIYTASAEPKSSLAGFT